MNPDFRYPWPASALTRSDMAVLHAVREGGDGHIPITELIARAVRSTYGAHLETEKSGRIIRLPASDQNQHQENAA
jgi:hypothetical protein